jgi:hypothetical protein
MQPIDARLGRLGVPWFLVLVAAAVIVLCNQGHAQTREHLLRGLSEVGLLVEKLSSGAKPCGVTEEAIRAAVMYPLSLGRHRPQCVPTDAGAASEIGRTLSSYNRRSVANLWRRPLLRGLGAGGGG